MARWDVLFGTLVITYLFLGGAAASVLLITCLWSIIFHGGRMHGPNREVAAFKVLRGRCYFVGFVLLVFSILCLLWDLGSPERALLLFIRPHMSILSVGAFALFAETLVAGVLMLVNYFDPQVVDGRIRKVLEYTCAMLSCAVMVYTGIFLAANDSVPFWSTWTLVALFFLSSFSSGNAIIMLMEYFNPDETRHANVIRPMSAAHIIALIFQAVFVVAFLGHAFSTPAAKESVDILLQSSVLLTGLIGVGIMGIAIPLAGEVRTLVFAADEGRTVPFSDFACLVGGFLLRYCVIVCGVH